MAPPRSLTIASRSPWRWPAAALALVITASHIPVTAKHLAEAPYIGWSFVALEIASVVLAGALVAHDARVTWIAAGVVPALAITAYVITRSVPLPQISDDVGNWAEPLGTVALTAEALLLVIVLAQRGRNGRSARMITHPLGVAAIMLALGLASIGYAAGREAAMTGMTDGHGMAQRASMLPPLQWASFLGHWHLRPWWLLFSVLALATYLGAVAVTRRHGVRSVHPARVACFVAGVALLLGTVSSAIDTYAMAIFWDHMVEHLLLIMVIPALLVLGHPLTAMRAAASTQGRATTVDAFARWPVSVLTHPVVSFGLYAAVIIATHLTGFMDAMATHAWLMEAEQWLYLITGCVYLVTLLGTEPLRWQPPYLGRLVLILVGMTPDTVVGIVLMQTTRRTFPVMEGGHPDWAPTPVDDLHIAGALMWVGGDGLMMLFGIGVTIAMISHPRSTLVIGQRLEAIRRRTLARHVALAGGTVTVEDDIDVDEDDTMLVAYNQMLARMNEQPASSSQES